MNPTIFFLASPISSVLTRKIVFLSWSVTLSRPTGRWTSFILNTVQNADSFIPCSWKLERPKPVNKCWNALPVISNLLRHINIRSFGIDVSTYYDLSWLLVVNLFRPMLPSLILKILDFIVHKISRGNSRILFLSQSPDLLSWFYVYLLDFGLICNLIHHLVLYPVSVRTLERIATPLPPSLTSLLTTCGSLHLVVTTCG